MLKYEEKKIMKRLWYKQQADNFVEALPVGNGRLGAMVYGRVEEEKISLNENTLWSGFPRDKILPNAKEGIKRAVKYLKEEKIACAEEQIFQSCLGEYTDSYIPAGNILIRSNYNKISEYYRELDIENAIATTQFYSESGYCVRRVLASAVDDVIIVDIQNEDLQNVTEISLEIPHPNKIEKAGDYLIATAIAPYYCAPCYVETKNPVCYDSFSENRALTYVIGIRVDTDCEIYDNKIIVKSPSFHLFIDVETNFDGYSTEPKLSKVNPKDICIKKLQNVLNRDYIKVKSEHINDYQNLFKRVVFDLKGVSKDYLPTDERLQEYSIDKTDVGLPVLLFDYGRYLTIASSRKGTQATNLQGIWNEEMRAPWSSNYTININTQMNYWHVEAVNLSECHYPLFQLIQNVSARGEKIANQHYGCRGWCSHHNTDIWGSAGAITGDDSSAVRYGFWPMSAAWLSRHIWEHYEYTLDKKFLEYNWNILKGSALFLLDWFEEDENGKLTAPISTSPENTFLFDGKEHFLSQGVAMDQAIASDIFSICIKAIDILNKDWKLSAELKIALKKLKMYSVGQKGQILEWNKEYVEAEPTHRHLSLLYGVYPGNSITQHTPEWFDAAKRTMELRGDEATGWSLAWKACIWARLRDGNKAKKFLDNMLRPAKSEEVNYKSGGGLYKNMMCAHPPFQIDGNFGITAAICEMLLQYNGDEPVVLPALPKEWKHGRIKGLIAKGGKTIDIEW